MECEEDTLIAGTAKERGDGAEEAEEDVGASGGEDLRSFFLECRMSSSAASSGCSVMTW